MDRPWQQLKLLLVVYLIGIAAGFSAYAAPLTVDSELARLELATIALKASISASGAQATGAQETGSPSSVSEAQTVMASMLAELDKLERLLSRSSPSVAQQSYARAFSAYADVVEGDFRNLDRTAQPTLTAEQLATLKEINEQLMDLRGALFAPLGMNSSPKPAPTVAVTIRALAGTDEMKGLHVECTPFALRHIVRNLCPFSSLTTTRAEPLIPGRYHFGAFRGDQLLGETDSRVGMAGENAQSVDIPVRSTR